MDPQDLAGGSFEVLAAYPSMADRVVRAEAEMRQFSTSSMADSLRGEQGSLRHGYRVERGTALIPVLGPLIPRGPVGTSRYGVTSYEALRSELRRAAADDEVSTIVLMIDSPGGYVSGVDTTAQAVLAARAKKPVLAVVEGMAASAAYWLASQADQVIVSLCSDVGSIGVVTMHLDVSRAMDSAGLKMTVIHAGAKKADGSPFAPLPDAVRADLERKMEQSRVTFAQAVVAGRARPGLDLQAVLATEADIFTGEQAIAKGLADRLGSLDQLLDAAPALHATRRLISGYGRQAETAALPAVEAEPSRLRAPTAELPSGGERERMRIAAILGHEYALGEGCRRSAEFLAFRTDMPAPEAIAALKIAFDAVKATAGGRTGTLDQEMIADEQPNLGIDGGELASLSDYQRGAFEAARLLGKHPLAGAEKASAPSSQSASTRPPVDAAGLPLEPGSPAPARRWP